MQKLKRHSPDFTQANIDKLAAMAHLFPSCITEARDAKGVLSRLNVPENSLPGSRLIR